MHSTATNGNTGTADNLHDALGWPNLDGPEITLLEAIAEYNSINRAAKVVGLSYKSAWEKVDTLNNLSEQALVVRMVGGSGGGGTILTPAGQRFLERVRLLRREFKRFMALFSGDPEDAIQTIKTLRRFEMKLSARNILSGKITGITHGAVNSVVEIALKGGDRLVSVITNGSVDRLGLTPEKEVLAIVKASSVMVGHEIRPETISARNILRGTVSKIIDGAVNDEVAIELPGGSTVTAIITKDSVQRLGLTTGQEACAVIKASSVMLAVA